MEEAEILDVILRYGDKLTCYNCGEKLIDKFNPREPVGILWVDPGERNYPREPDAPPEAYFECVKCYREREKR